MKRSLVWVIGLSICFETISAHAQPRLCTSHHGVIRYNASGAAICADGSVDKRSISHAKPHYRPVHLRVLRFKRPPDRGQILRPGEVPPATTMAQSK